jgi:hypothetical protein
MDGYGCFVCFIREYVRDTQVGQTRGLWLICSSLNADAEGATQAVSLCMAISKSIMGGRMGKLYLLNRFRHSTSTSSSNA